MDAMSMLMRRLLGIGGLLLSLGALNQVTAQTLTIGSANGNIGQTDVWFNVSFDPQGLSVAGILHTLHFDRYNAPITQCTLGTALDGVKLLSYVRLPEGCVTGGSSSAPACDRVAILVKDRSDNDGVEIPRAITSSTVLYSCRVDVPSTAAASAYPIIATTLSATDPAGNRKPIQSVEGAFTVNSPGPGPGC
ncbi:MAG TPA: hypothetical protein VEB21_19125 [Terriglobales bacterium]|nr:hypothetical protein [Terriglobales bacterium]